MYIQEKNSPTFYVQSFIFYIQLYFFLDYFAETWRKIDKIDEIDKTDRQRRQIEKQKKTSLENLKKNS